MAKAWRAKEPTSQSHMSTAVSPADTTAAAAAPADEGPYMFTLPVVMSFAVIVLLAEHVLVRVFAYFQMFALGFVRHWLHFTRYGHGDAHEIADAVEVQHDRDDAARIAALQNRVEQLEDELDRSQRDAFNYMELHEHGEEELRALRDQLRELRNAVDEHRELGCPLGRPIYKTRFGSHWHCDSQCRYIVDRNPDAIAPCTGCAHNRPLWRPTP